MKRLRMMGFVMGVALSAAFCAGQANAEELTGTLKKIKETRRFHFPIWTTTRSRSVLRSTFVTASSTP